MYFVYFLECADSTIYVGMTSDLDKRLQQHSIGFYPRCYTYSRRPVELIYLEAHNWVEFAIAAETRYKKWSRKKKAALASKNISQLKELSKCHYQLRKKQSEEDPNTPSVL